MKPCAVKWFLLLALNTSVCVSTNPFTLKNKSLTVMEESCVEIRCEVSLQATVTVEEANAYWFWMKDAEYVNGSFTGTTIYSTNEFKRPVSPQFKDRVKYTGSPTWQKYAGSNYCSILICDVKKTDSGKYQFRFVGGYNKVKWVTEPSNVSVADNPCPLTFNKSGVVMEDETVTLTCSTISSCQSVLQISVMMQQFSPSSNNKHTTQITTHSFKTSWTDNGKMFSCQTEDNTDKYLIKNFTLTVKHGPKEVKATQSPNPVKENNFVTLTCSAKGSPDVTFMWVKDNIHNTSGAELKFTSVKASDSGSYYCTAWNEYGIVKSNTLKIDVFYAPEVSVKINQLPGRRSGYIEEGDNITLECFVIRSNPQPLKFTWKKIGTVGTERIHVLDKIKPEHSGTYTCEAKNSVGSGRQIKTLQVQYKPRSSIQLQFASGNTVKINKSLKLTCATKAYPKADYSWFRYTELNKSHLKWLGGEQTLTLNSVKRSDEACYICNATNIIGKGNMSQPVCIQVLYPPTNVQLTLPSKVRENQSITISCSAESSPLSSFEIRSSSSELISQSADKQNLLNHTFTVTEAHAGFYKCEASNTEGKNTSSERKLEVEYPPKDVKITAQNGLEVKENETFSLRCSGRSNPAITSFGWVKRTGNKNVGKVRVYSVKSASLSDGGLYSCEAKNQIGTGQSQPVEVKILHAPKLTTISKGKERELSGGRRSVTLSCISHSYPAATFKWYNKTEEKTVSVEQNFTVYSHHAGEYYCTAENKFGKTRSDSIKVFVDGGRMVMLFILICFCVLIILLFFFLYRRKKSNEHRTTNTWPFCGFLVCWNGPWRRTGRNETMLAEPFRSRDDLMPEQPCRPNTQPLPDVTSASNNNLVYATVNLPQKVQPVSAQKPAGPQCEPVENNSINYASLYFKKKKKKPEEDSVYSQVCKPKSLKEKAKQPTVYENFHMMNSAKPSYSYEDDSDTSEDEVELSYSQVNFQPKPDHQRATRDSSSSEDTQYSQIKL